MATINSWSEKCFGKALIWLQTLFLKSIQLSLDRWIGLKALSQLFGKLITGKFSTSQQSHRSWANLGRCNDLILLFHIRVLMFSLRASKGWGLRARDSDQNWATQLIVYKKKRHWGAFFRSRPALMRNSLAYSSDISGSGALGVAAAAALGPKLPNSLALICNSISAAISGFSVRKTPTLALPWPILLPL